MAKVILKRADVGDLEAAWFRADHAKSPEDPPPPVTSDQLAAADDAAQQTHPATTDSGSVSCAAKTLPLLVRITGEDEKPMENVAFELRNAEGQALTTRSGADGIARFAGIAAGAYELALPGLDQDAWEILSSRKADTAASGTAAWQAAESHTDAGATRTIEEGECISTLALELGFHPETIWNDSANATLKSLRKDMNILARGDDVAIPARRVVARPVEAGMLVEVRRKGVPDVVRFRFLDAAGQPRANLPYLAELEDADGIEQRSGTTNGDGYVIEKAGASLRRVSITLASEDEVHEFLPATLDPIETVGGVQDRLNNLGYPCGGEDGEVGPLTRRALRDFQQDFGLTASGEIDDATRRELQAQHLS